MECAILDNIVTLYRNKEEREMINYLQNSDINQVRRLLWVSFESKDVIWIANVIMEHNLKNIYSIGCGCGLVEWLIQQNCNCDIIGVEIDESWWSSKYSPPIFLENMIYLSEPDNTIEMPRDCGILFCYFNNELVFMKYLQEFKGSVIFVIGPKTDQNRYTNPLPFDQRFTDHGWQLSQSHDISLSRDCVCVYIKSQIENCTFNS